MSQPIQRQFHHLVRIVPGSGRIVWNAADARLRGDAGDGVLDAVRGLRAVSRLRSAHWTARASGRCRGFLALRGARARPAARHRAVGADRRAQHGERARGHRGGASCRRHRRARHRGAAVVRGVARRMQLRGEVNGVRVYDDFAHHPTAIATTIDGLRRRVGSRADRRRAGAALQHHEHGRASRNTGSLPGRRGRGLVVHARRPGLGCRQPCSPRWAGAGMGAATWTRSRADLARRCGRAITCSS